MLMGGKSPVEWTSGIFTTLAPDKGQDVVMWVHTQESAAGDLHVLL